MNKSIFIFLIIILFCTVNFAQTEVVCPKIEVIAPPGLTDPGEDAVFTAIISNVSDGQKIEYEWSIDQGTIIEGQKKLFLKVSTDGLEDTTLTATVTFQNLPAICKNKFSATTVITFGIEDYFPEDEIFNVPKNEVRANIDNLFIRLQNDPTVTAYLISYGTEKEIKKREKLIESHIKKRKYNKSRIVFMQGGNESKIRTEVYLIPEGATPPTP